MSRERERFDEIGKRESDVSSHYPQMGRRHMLGTPGTLNTITPCAACKLLRRRCAQEYPFSPYFSLHETQKFASVHKVFGASNVSKLLMEVPVSQRADAANSLVYEANVRLRDPVYGEANLILPSSHVALLSSGAVSVAAPPPAPTQPPPPPPPPPPPLLTTSTSSMYTQPTTSADYNTISNENISYFG
ncbi:hypothetical protein REPUB_Repub03eG0275300 [Reevesia pubescens]